VMSLGEFLLVFCSFCWSNQGSNCKICQCVKIRLWVNSTQQENCFWETLELCAVSMIDQFEPDWSYVASNRNCVKMILWAHPTSKYPWHWLFTHQVCSLTLFIVSLWTERSDDMTLFVFVGCRGKCFVATSWKILMQHTEVMAARLPPCVIVSFEHMSLPGFAPLPPQVSFFYLSFHIWTL
jgi:hypothetical protein